MGTKIFSSSLWLIMCYFVASLAHSENMPQHDTFDEKPQERWRFVTDQVMGGVSTGQLRFDVLRDQPVAHMTGEVSTANNGGFIQFRRKISAPENSSGIEIRVRGNGETYFIHLRTSGTFLPWQYYQASFITSQEWRIIQIPFSKFVGSSDWLNSVISPQSIRSLGIVAYGRDHQADISVSMAGFF